MLAEGTWRNAAAGTTAASFQDLLEGLETGATDTGTTASGTPMARATSYGSYTATGSDVVAGAASALGVDPSGLAASTGTNPSAGRMLSWASAQVGTLEKAGNVQPYAPMVGHANGAAWCASFATAVAANGGAALPQGANSAWTVAQRGAFKAAGAWTDAPAGDPTSVARPGDLVYFRNRGTGAVVDHVGVVVGRTGDGRLVTVEGNTSGPGGDGVHYKLRGPGDRIVGYGRPLYPQGGAVPAGWSVPTRLS